MKRYILSLILSLIWAIVGLIGFSDTLYAAPAAPLLTLKTEGINITASWSSEDNPDGYILFLAPYPDAHIIYQVDMGSQRTITADLWNNAAFYMAIEAYDSTGNSDFSNVEYFIIKGSNDDISDNSESARIVLQGDSITATGSGVAVNGSIATITSAGSYSISGTLANGEIIVDTEDEGAVTLIMDGVNISNSTTAPIYVVNADSTVITLADNSSNHITDGKLYMFDDPEEDEPDAAIFSKSDLTINGNGSLFVDANYNDGIKSKDGLIITSGTITVDSVDDGIMGKDFISIKGGNITVNAGGDGFKATNDTDSSKGYISIEAGVVKITSGADAIQAESNVAIANGEITLYSGGGSGTMLIDADASAKGVKAAVGITIDNGSIKIDSADDAINSNGNIEINGGSFAIASGDDGFHANSSLEINGGEINITKSYEGIESAIITINNGTIHIVSSDDGLNVAGGKDSSGIPDFPGGGSTILQLPGGGGGQVWPGQDMFDTSTDYYLYINGGYIVVDAYGDGIDANGSIEMAGGVVIVNGPTDNNNGALDYDGSFKITGGFLLAAGSSGMAQIPDNSSSQYSMLVNFSSAKSGGTLVNIQTSSGKELFTFAPSKSYQSIAFSSPEVAMGSTYDVYYGGSSTGTVNDGLYKSGVYTPGTKYTGFTVSSVVTNIR